MAALSQAEGLEPRRVNAVDAGSECGPRRTRSSTDAGPAWTVSWSAPAAGWGCAPGLGCKEAGSDKACSRRRSQRRRRFRCATSISHERALGPTFEHGILLNSGPIQLLDGRQRPQQRCWRGGCSARSIRRHGDRRPLRRLARDRARGHPQDLGHRFQVIRCVQAHRRGGRVVHVRPLAGDRAPCRS